MKKKKLFLSVFVVGVMLVAAGCGSSEQVAESVAEEIKPMEIETNKTVEENIENEEMEAELVVQMASEEEEESFDTSQYSFLIYLYKDLDRVTANPLIGLNFSDEYVVADYWGNFVMLEEGVRYWTGEFQISGLGTLNIEPLGNEKVAAEKKGEVETAFGIVEIYYDVEENEEVALLQLKNETLKFSLSSYFADNYAGELEKMIPVILSPVNNNITGNGNVMEIEKSMVEVNENRYAYILYSISDKSNLIPAIGFNGLDGWEEIMRNSDEVIFVSPNYDGELTIRTDNDAFEYYFGENTVMRGVHNNSYVIIQKEEVEKIETPFGIATIYYVKTKGRNAEDELSVEEEVAILNNQNTNIVISYLIYTNYYDGEYDGKSKELLSALFE